MQRSKSRPWAALVVLAVSCLLSAPSAHGQEERACRLDQLTEDCAAAMALARPDLVAAWESAYRTADGEAEAAGRWSNPLFGVEHAQVFDRGESEMEDVLRLEQRLPLSGRPALLREAATKRAEAVRLAVTQARLDATDRGRRGFYGALAASQRVSALRRIASRLRAAGDDVARREAAGDVSRYDLLRVRREIGEAASRLQVAEAEAEFQHRQLRALLGHATTAGLPSLQGTLLPVDAPPPLDELVAALDERPDLRALAAEASAAEIEREAAERSRWPEIGITAGLKTVGGERDRATGFVVGISVPLPLFDRGQAGAAAAIRRGQQADTRRTIRWEESHRALAGTRTRLLALTREAHRYHEGPLRDAEALAAITRRAYQAGELGVLELVDALHGLGEAEERAVSLALSVREAQLDLDRLCGKGIR